MRKNTFNPSTVKNIDTAVFKYFKDLKISTETNRGFIEIPVVWAGAERSFQIKSDNFLRDKDGALILPQIAVLRSSVDKSISFDKKGLYAANLRPINDAKGGVIHWSKRINPEKTSEFIRNDYINGKTFSLKKNNEKVVYQHYSIPIPTYLWIKYEIVVRTEYQAQMNDVLQGIIQYLGGANYFIAENEGWRYECFLEESLGYETNADSFDEDDRTFVSKIGVNCLGYTIGGGKNQEQPNVAIRENAVTIALEESTMDTPRRGSVEIPPAPFEEVLDARFLPEGKLSEWQGYYGRYSATQPVAGNQPTVEKVGNYNAVVFTYTDENYMDFNWPDLISKFNYPAGGPYPELTIYTVLADTGANSTPPYTGGRFWAACGSAQPTKTGLSLRQSTTGVRVQAQNDLSDLTANFYVTSTPDYTSNIIVTIRLNIEGTYDAWYGNTRVLNSSPYLSNGATSYIDSFVIGAIRRSVGYDLFDDCKIYALAFGLGKKTNNEVLRGISILKEQYDIQ